MSSFLSYEQAKNIYLLIDWIHPGFLYLDIIAILALLESYLPKKHKFESGLDKLLTYFKFGVLGFFALVALSQGYFGGCFLHTFQNWLSDTYLNGRYHNPYGLFARQIIPVQYHILLRALYFVGSNLIVWRVYKYWMNRLPRKPVEQTNANVDFVDSSMEFAVMN